MCSIYYEPGRWTIRRVFFRAKYGKIQDKGLNYFATWLSGLKASRGLLQKVWDSVKKWPEKNPIIELVSIDQRL